METIKDFTDKLKKFLDMNGSARRSRLGVGVVFWENQSWYHRNDGGLIISDVMKQETARHLSQNDFVEEFISDNYELNPKHEIKAKDLIDALKREYPRETSRFKRADLIKLIESVEDITYEFGGTKTHVFKGIAPLAK